MDDIMTAPASSPGGIITSILLAAGPLVTWAVLSAQVGPHLLAGETGFLAIAVLALWSPLFFSIPALVLQESRDRALPELRGVFGSSLRSLILVPHLMRHGSEVRLPMTASVLGFALALVVLAPEVRAAVGLLGL